MSVITSFEDFNDFANTPILPSTISAIAYNAFSTAVYDARLSAISLNNVVTAGDALLSGAVHMRSISALALTSIPVSAFAYDEVLRNTKFASATNIGNYAFYNCDALLSVDVPNATAIGNNSFAYCTSLSSCAFGSLTSLGLSAFNNCSSLTNISLGNIVSVPNYAFYNCINLSSIIIPKTVTSTLGLKSFYGTSASLKAIFDKRLNTDTIFQS